MSAPTPGPWYVDGLAIQAGPNNNVGLVNLARASVADARLIAAAPDMAEALRDAVQLIDQIALVLDRPIIDARLPRIRAALAKAGL